MFIKTDKGNFRISNIVWYKYLGKEDEAHKLLIKERDGDHSLVNLNDDNYEKFLRTIV